MKKIRDIFKGIRDVKTDISVSCLSEIKKIVRKWSNVVKWVFIFIIISFFQGTFFSKIQDRINENISGYEGVLIAFLETLPESIKPLAFLLIPVLLGLITYTTYTLIRIWKRSNFYSIQHIRYYLWPLLANSMFVLLISFVGIHCLQFSHEESALCRYFLGNFGIGIIFFVVFLFLKIKKVRKVFWSIAVIGFFLIVIYLNWPLMDETFHPAVRYFRSFSNEEKKERSFKKLSVILKPIECVLNKFCLTDKHPEFKE